MNLEKLGNALAKSKNIAITLLGNLLYRTRVEPIRDTEGIKGLKAHWIGDPGENVMEINTPSGSTDLKIDGNTAPTIEYVQEGEKRTIAVRHIKNLSCELNLETMDPDRHAKRRRYRDVYWRRCRITRLVSGFGDACATYATNRTEQFCNNSPDCPYRR